MTKFNLSIALMLLLGGRSVASPPVECEPLKQQAIEAKSHCGPGNRPACESGRAIAAQYKECVISHAKEDSRLERERDAERERKSNEQARQAMDEFKHRQQITEETAQSLSLADRAMLLSGIACDAEDQAQQAIAEIKKEKQIGKTSGAVDLAVLHDQGIIAEEQRARAKRARAKLGKTRVPPCSAEAARQVVDCIRANLGIGHPTDETCLLPEFWKYQEAIASLDSD